VSGRRLKVCVLQPDYTASAVDYRHYDPRRDLGAILPAHEVDHVFLDKRTTFRQVREASAAGYDIFVNLCEGYLDWDVPSIDVIHALDRLRLPYTGPNALLYDPSKVLMKYVAHTAGVRTPAHRIVRTCDDLDRVVSALRFPLFVKPAHAGDSLGVDEHALVADRDALRAQVQALLPEYPELLVEEYVDGREFTVLLAGDPEGRGASTAFTPVEYEFPPGFHFKTYALKTSELHPTANVPVHNAALDATLRETARRVFRAFDGVGYARMDFRMDADGALFFLEVNFTCSVFYPAGSEGSADHILRHDGIGQAGFAERIIAEGMARHRRGAARYTVEGNALAGYGIFATAPLAAGDIVFRGEERAHRIVTRRHVAEHWSNAEQELFRHYAYPLSDEVYALWDADPTAWAPQNHSCEPNTAFSGLDVVALRPIARGEELTLDYARSMNESSAPFSCHCGASTCRGQVAGAPHTSVTARESARRE
jgi:D-alanine-D-alanine ligase